MGHKMKQIMAAILGSWCTVSFATDVVNTAWYSSDSDGSTTAKYSSSRIDGSWGIRAQNTVWSGISSNKSPGVGITVQKWNDNGGINGHITVNSGTNHRWVDADISGDYAISKNVKVSSGLFADTLTSYRLSPGDITISGVFGGVELNQGLFGATSVLKWARRSDGTEQTTVTAKASMHFMRGGTGYVVVKNYTNTGTSTQYFSPLRHNRAGAGINYRLFWNSGTVKLNLEATRVINDGVEDKTVLGSIDLEQRISSKSRVGFLIGKDYSLAGNYTYTYKQIVYRTTF